MKKRFLAIGISLMIALCLWTGALGEIYDEGEILVSEPVSENTENPETTETPPAPVPEGVTWNLDDNGVLTISGNGAMEDLYSYNYPWSYRTIRQVVVQAGVTSVGKYAFNNQDQLTAVSLADTVTSIGDSAFIQCSALQSVTMSNAITGIGNSAFKGCSSLKSISLPGALTSIGDSAFHSCLALQNITLPGTVTSIGDSVFSGCSALQSITLPASITSMGDSVFYGCGALQSATVSASVTSLGERTFSGCGSLQTVTLPGTLTSIENYVFNECSMLQNITLPNSLTSIGYGAFYRCTALQSVTMPTALTNLGNAAFSGCSALQSITLPDHISEMGYQTFDSGIVIYASIGSDTAKTLGMKNLSFRTPGTKYDLQYELSYNYQDGTYSISGLAIKNISSSVTSFEVPDGVTLIATDTFAECKNLKELILPDSIDTIRYNALANCTKLKTLTLPDNISSIGYGAFPSSLLLYAKIGSTTAKELGNISREFRIEESTCDLMYSSGSDSTAQLLMLAGIDNSKKSVTVPDGVEGIKGGALYANAESSYYPTKPIKLETLTLPASIQSLSLSSFAGVGKTFYVKVKKGSYAESFARAHGLQYDNGSKKVIGCNITSVDEKVNWIVSNYVTSDMSEREKARVLHDWLIMNAHYDLTYSSYNADGVLINGSGVCDSYSKAFVLLATRAGLANRRLTGTSANGGGHAWNLVRIDGQWYHLDATWDDPVHSVSAQSVSNEPTVSGMEGTRYFLVSDSGIGHHWSGGISADNNQVTGYYDNGVAYHYSKEGNYQINTATGKATLVLGKSTATKVTIPDTITENGVAYQVTAIAAEAYANNTKLTTVSIGKNVKSIGRNAFAGCTKLTGVTMGSGVTSIGNSAFSGCTKLTKVTIGKKVSTIGDSAFAGCSKLKTLTMGASVTTIGAEAFSGCKALTKVTLPAKVKKIGKKAFYGCKKLKTIEIKTTKLTSKNVGADAFSGISSKATIKVPSKKLKSYQKILMKKGVSKTATIK